MEEAYKTNETEGAETHPTGKQLRKVGLAKGGGQLLASLNTLYTAQTWPSQEGNLS